MIKGMRVAKLGKKSVTIYLYATVEEATFHCKFFELGNCFSKFFQLTALFENADGSVTTPETIMNDADEVDTYPVEWPENEDEANEMADAIMAFDALCEAHGVDFWV